MKTNIFIFLSIILFPIPIFSQYFMPGQLWVSVTDDEARHGQGEFTKNEELNAILNTFNVYAYDQIMWFAKTPSLRDIYEIRCDCDEVDLKILWKIKLMVCFHLFPKCQSEFTITNPKILSGSVVKT